MVLLLLKELLHDNPKKHSDYDEVYALVKISFTTTLAAPVHIVSVVSDTIFQYSARLKANHKCSIADTIGLATAIELSGQFVTSDHHELEAVAKNESISFLWLHSHPKK
jgi:predicted nucleic acid-binding protein